MGHFSPPEETVLGHELLDEQLHGAQLPHLDREQEGVRQLRRAGQMIFCRSFSANEYLFGFPKRLHLAPQRVSFWARFY